MITIGIDDLNRALRAARHFTVGDEDWHPVLESVHLEAARGTLCMSATTRYVAGHIRTKGIGTLPGLLLHRDWVHVATEALSRATEQGAAQVRAITRPGEEDGVLEIATPIGLTLRLPATHPRNFPDIAKLFARRDREPASLDGPIGIQPAMIRPFANAAQDLQVDEHWHWYFAGPKNPVRLQIGDQFAGLVMPVSLRDVAAPFVPVGLPA